MHKGPMALEEDHPKSNQLKHAYHRHRYRGLRRYGRELKPRLPHLSILSLAEFILHLQLSGKYRRECFE
jgi:hypothetical protein